MTIKQAIKKLGAGAIKSIVKELMQLNDRGTFEAVKVDDMQPEQRKRIITTIIGINKSNNKK